MHQAFSKGFVLEIQYIPTICNRVQRAPKTQEMVFYYCGAPIFNSGGGAPFFLSKPCSALCPDPSATAMFATADLAPPPTIPILGLGCFIDFGFRFRVLWVVSVCVRAL